MTMLYFRNILLAQIPVDDRDGYALSGARLMLQVRAGKSSSDRTEDGRLSFTLGQMN